MSLFTLVCGIVLLALALTVSSSVWILPAVCTIIVGAFGLSEGV